MSHHHHRTCLASITPCVGCLLTWILCSSPSFAADTINGRVLAAGGPIVGSAVTLWAESTGAPRQLAQSQTGPDGRFMLTADSNGAILYVVAKGGRAGQGGDNTAIALMSVLGSTVPASVVVNEMTTIASVWTTNRNSSTVLQFRAIRSVSKIAAGNVPNFVDLQSGRSGFLLFRTL